MTLKELSQYVVGVRTEYRNSLPDEDRKTFGKPNKGNYYVYFNDEFEFKTRSLGSTSSFASDERYVKQIAFDKTSKVANLITSNDKVAEFMRVSSLVTELDMIAKANHIPEEQIEIKIDGNPIYGELERDMIKKTIIANYGDVEDLKESILDQPQEQMDPSVWQVGVEGTPLTPEAEAKIQQVVDWVTERYQLPDLSVLIIGSITSNCYTETSDIDIDFVSHFMDDKTPDEISEFGWSMKSDFMKNFPDQMLGSHPLEIFFQPNQFQCMMSAGCYNFTSKKWEVGPELKPQDYDPVADYYDGSMKIIGKMISSIRDSILAVYESALVCKRAREEQFKSLRFDELVVRLSKAAEVFKQIKRARSAFPTDPSSKEEALKMRSDKAWHTTDAAFKFLDKFGYVSILKKCLTLTEEIEDGVASDDEVIDAVIDAVKDNLAINTKLNDSEKRFFTEVETIVNEQEINESKMRHEVEMLFESVETNEFGEQQTTLDSQDEVFKEVNDIVSSCKTKSFFKSKEGKETDMSTLSLGELARVEGGHYVAKVYGGENGWGEFQSYLETVKQLVDKLGQKFSKPWLVDWVNDCADDVWTLRIAFRDKKHYKITGAILGCLGDDAERVNYKITEQLDGDPWIAIIESDGDVTKEELDLWHELHVKDVDGKGVPYYFIVIDSEDNSTYVWYSDDDAMIPINTIEQQLIATNAGLAKGLVKDQLDFSDDEDVLDESKKEKSSASMSPDEYSHHLLDRLGADPKYVPRHTNRSIMDSLAHEYILEMPTDTAAREIEMDAALLLVKSENEEDIKLGKKLGDMVISGKGGDKLLAVMRKAYLAFLHMPSDINETGTNSSDTPQYDRVYNEIIKLICQSNNLKFGARDKLNRGNKCILLWHGDVKKDEYGFDNYSSCDKAWDPKKSWGLVEVQTFPHHEDLSQQQADEAIEKARAFISKYSTKQMNEDQAKVKIWVDDVRPTPAGYMTINSVDDFIKWFDANGSDKIEVLDLDHDAGQFHDQGGDYIKILDYLEFKDVESLRVRIHSDNPVGRQNMQRIIKKNGWEEVFDLQEGVEVEIEEFKNKPHLHQIHKTPLAKKQLARSGKAHKKHFKHFKPLKRFKNNVPLNNIKSIGLSAQDVRKFKTRNSFQVIKTGDECDLYKVGDYIRVPWDAYYRVSGKRYANSLSLIPNRNALTKNDAEKILANDKIAVLTLALVKRDDDKLHESQEQVDEGVKEVVSAGLLASLLAVPGILSAKTVQKSINDNQKYEMIVKDLNQNVRMIGGYTAFQAANIIARTLYAEARNDGKVGMEAIASVIYNRAKGNKTLFTNACLKPMQFSCWNKFTKEEADPKNFKIKIPKTVNGNKKNEALWKDAMQIAADMLADSFKPTTTANSYFNPQKCSPKWGKELTDVAMIGSHKFGTLKNHTQFV